MAKVRNVSGQALDVPRPHGYEHVGEGAVLEVADDEVWGYTQQATTWVPSGKDTQVIHDKAEKNAEPSAPPDPEPPVTDPTPAAVKES